MNNNDYRLYDKYINTFNVANISNKYSLSNQFKNRCSAIRDYDDIKTWSEALIQDNVTFNNKRIELDNSPKTTIYTYTIEFYKYNSNIDGYNGTFYMIDDDEDISGNYIIKNTDTIIFFNDTEKFKIENNDGNILFYNKDIDDDISKITDDFIKDDIIDYEGVPKITSLTDVDTVLSNNQSWNSICNNNYLQNDTYYDDFSIQSSGLINNRNDEIRKNIRLQDNIAINDEENSYIKKFYNSDELGNLDIYRNEDEGYLYQMNTGLRKAIGVSYEEVYNNNEGEIPALFLAPNNSGNDKYVGFGSFDDDNISLIDNDHEIFKIIDSSINTTCYGFRANPDNKNIEKDTNAVCLLDYMNVHLEQYQRYLCDKLPNNPNYITQNNINTCNNLKNSLWRWTPNKDYTKSKNISYDEFDKWNKLETEKDRFIQNKKDTKEPYFNKKTKILLLIIGILVLLYLVKKY